MSFKVNDVVCWRDYNKGEICDYDLVVITKANDKVANIKYMSSVADLFFGHEFEVPLSCLRHVEEDELAMLALARMGS